ncbi:MAG: hypothetical protein DMG50_02540 [Acidobacteria bacterium]|nr:MAG: hypothetical protein DMG50_02540 [Acidobacteriota bacterium]
MGSLLRNDRSFVPEQKSRQPQTAALAQGSMESSSDGNPSRETTVLPRILLLRPAITALILGVVGLLVFLAGIGRPARMFYDEGYFVPEARTFRLSTPLPP